MVLENFWRVGLETYPKLAEKTLAVFPFSTTYLSEAGFSSLIYLKNKYRSGWKLWKPLGYCHE